MTFTIFTGKGGDPAQPLPWPEFDAYLAGQWGLIASPTWLEAVKSDPAKASQPVGTGPFVYESYAPRDAFVLTRTPTTGCAMPTATRSPTSTAIEYRVIEDPDTAGEALQSGQIDIMATGTAPRDQRLPESRRRVRSHHRGRADRHQLHPHRPVEGQSARRPAGALRDCRWRSTARSSSTPPEPGSSTRRTGCSRRGSRVTSTTTGWTSTKTSPPRRR